MIVDDLFYIYSGSKLDYGKQTESVDGINFVSRNSNNNGVVGRVILEEGMKTFKKGDITVPLGGSYLLSAFVQDEDFITAQNVCVLRPKKKMTEIEKWFYCYSLRLNRFKFSAFGREVNKYIKEIELPNKIPDWVYSHKIEKIETKNSNKYKKLDTESWKEMKIKELFDVVGSKTTPVNKLEEYGYGKYPYITTQSKNNGVAGSYDFYTEEGNVLTIDSAVLGYCTYQEFNFSASDHVEKLIPKFKMNKYIALFFVTLINKENFRYNYGIKYNQGRIRETNIRIPVDSNNKPDYIYMEKFIRELPYGDRI